MVDNDAFNGNYEKNPFNFKHYDLSSLKVMLDGNQQQHIKPLEPNFAQQNYVDAFLTLFAATGKLHTDEGLDINRTDFAGGYALYAFDLTPDMSEDGHFNLIRDGSFRLEVKFAKPLPNTVNVIIYAEFEHVLEILRNREILLESANQP